MRVLGIDPGAIRCGWAVIEGTEFQPKEVASGFLGLERHVNNGKAEEFQKYRLRLMDFWIDQTEVLLATYFPDIVVNEIVPPVGGNIANGIQRQLATTAVTTIQIVSKQQGYRVEQVGASTVKRRIGKTGRATKIAVRSGVYQLMPSMREKYHREWTKTFDHCDAVAIALTSLGYKN